MKKKYFEELIKIADSERNDILQNTFLPSHAVIPTDRNILEMSNIDSMWQQNLLEMAKEEAPDFDVSDEETSDKWNNIMFKILELESYCLDTFEGFYSDKYFTIIDKQRYTFAKIRSDKNLLHSILEGMVLYFGQVALENGARKEQAPSFGLVKLWEYEHAIFWREMKSKIQTSTKFCIEADTQNNHLTQKEIDALAMDVPLLLPYQRCILEVFEPEERNIFYILLEQTDFVFDNEKAFQNTKWQSNLIGGVRFMVFSKPLNDRYGDLSKRWCTDHIWYELQWFNRHTVKEGEIPLSDTWHGYRFQISKIQPILKGNYIDQSGKEDSHYDNQSLTKWVDFANNAIFKFLCLLHYPAICDSKRIKGISPREKKAVKNLKHTIF